MRTSRPPTPQEIEETDHQDWTEQYLHDAKFLKEYYVPEWVWQQAVKNYWVRPPRAWNYWWVGE